MKPATLLIFAFLLPATASPLIARSDSFYDGSLDWLWPPDGSYHTMSGFGTTANGGTVTSVTVCLSNDWVMPLSFVVDVVVSSSAPAETITFSSSFPPNVVTCHELTGFDTYVAPGEFKISAGYDSGTPPHLSASFPATASGETFDVEIAGQRPPFAAGPQGLVQMHGAGLRYEIDRDATPQVPPSPPPLICDASEDNLCYLRAGRFLVSSGRDGDMGYLDGVVVSGNEGSVIFRFSAPGKWELLANVQPRPGGAYVFSATGLSSGRSYELRVVEVATGQGWEFLLDSSSPGVTNAALE
jgi:hypothetical protein